MIFTDFANELPEFEFKVWVGNAITEAFQFRLPVEAAWMQFQNMATQIAQQNVPMKVVCISTVSVPQFNGECKQKPAKFIFYNPTYEKELGINE
jgi:hypothetical protein